MIMLPVWYALEISKNYHMRSIFMSKRKYTKEFKLKVLKGQSIAVKYGIHAESTVLKCARQYNSHEELIMRPP